MDAESKEEVDFDGTAEADSDSEKVDYGKLLSNRSVWIVPIIFVVFNIGYYEISTYMSTYLVEGVGTDPASANLAVSWQSLVGLPAAIIVGILLDRTQVKNRKYIVGIVMVVLAVCYALAFRMPSVGAATFLMIFTGFIVTFVPVSLYTIGPDIIRKGSYAAIILAIVTFGQSFGSRFESGRAHHSKPQFRRIKQLERAFFSPPENQRKTGENGIKRGDIVRTSYTPLVPSLVHPWRLGNRSDLPLLRRADSGLALTFSIHGTD